MSKRFCLVAILLAGQACSQTVTVALENGCAQLWQHHLFVSGLRSGGQMTELVIYRFNDQLKMEDSLVLLAGKGSAGDFLRTGSDTLHGFLNVYLQRKGQDHLKIVRLDRQMKLSGEIEGVEIARLHNRAMLGTEPYYQGNHVYSIRTVADTGGRQFFLNAYALKDAKANFDYQLSWQFAFERKNIARARIIHAGSRLVTLFAEVGSGPKKGEWLLTINSKTGLLLRGSKLNSKTEDDYYQFGVCKADTINKLLHLMGEKHLSTGKKRTGSFHSFYYTVVDSLGAIVTRSTFSVPVTEPKRGKAKTIPGFKVVFEKLRADATGAEAEADLYINADGKSCHNYCGTITIRLAVAGDMVTAEKSEIRSNRLIEDWLYLQDQGRMNGKTCSDSSGEPGPLRHATLPFPVKAGYKKEKQVNSWLLQKTETGKGRISFARTAPEKNVMKIFAIGEIPKSQAPALFVTGSSTYLLVNDGKSGGLEITSGSW